MFPTRAAPAVLVLVVASLAPAAARAESYHTCAGFIDSLPAVISTQGTWCLRGLRHCSIRGFRSGVSFTGTGGGHLVEDNRFDGNTVVGIETHGDGSMIRRNFLFDTGNSTEQGSIFAIQTSQNVDVRDNVIDGVAADLSFTNRNSTGVLAFSNERGAIVGNRIGGLQSTGTGTSRGIYNSSSSTVTMRDNILVGEARAGGTGIACSNAEGLAVDNIVMKFVTPVATCTEAGTTP